jgi:hypothetical protein
MIYNFFLAKDYSVREVPVEFTENSPRQGCAPLRKVPNSCQNPQRANAKVRMWLGLESHAALPEGCGNTHFQGCT